MILQEQKVYVTDRLREQAEAVWRCIGENNGHFYVCGDAGKMAKVSSRNLVLNFYLSAGQARNQYCDGPGIYVSVYLFALPCYDG